MYLNQTNLRKKKNLFYALRQKYNRKNKVCKCCIYVQKVAKAYKNNNLYINICVWYIKK